MLLVLPTEHAQRLLHTVQWAPISGCERAQNRRRRQKNLYTFYILFLYIANQKKKTFLILFIFSPTIVLWKHKYIHLLKNKNLYFTWLRNKAFHFYLFIFVFILVRLFWFEHNSTVVGFFNAFRICVRAKKDIESKYCEQISI